MITIVVPTYNRAYTLKLVVHTFYEQEGVSEIIFVNDAGTDNTHEIINEVAKKYNNIRTVYLKNNVGKGAAYSRMKGVNESTNEYVLFCDDDDFLEPGYANVCHKKIIEQGASIVSGRHLYRLQKENLSDAVQRFSTGISKQRTFDKLRFKINTDACFQGDLIVPFTHGIFMSTKSLLEKYGLDSFYSKGNGFREETDVQFRAFIDGHNILVTNEVHAVHLHPSEVRHGGQRVSRLKRFYWTIFYTNYFFKKYFDESRKKLNIPYNKTIAILLYSIVETYVFFIRPFIILPARVVQRLQR